jgi:prepilin-type N-terminal cleavage/methylation domain-containing protein
MNTSRSCRKSFLVGIAKPAAAFTLVELLIVVAVIGILASLIMPIGKTVKIKQRLSVAQAELSQLQTAIGAYREKLGFYPPDNPGNPVFNPLYFELKGTYQTNNNYVVLDGSSWISAANLSALFGANITGLMNCSKNARGGDEGTAAINFLKAGLRPNQVGKLGVNGATNDAILVCSIPWTYPDPKIVPPPISSPPAPPPPPLLNPWRYVSSSPTNNASSYDLWADIYINGKIYRVSNWSKQPQIL